jgi:superfamily II DNA helicase RecQ
VLKKLLPCLQRQALMRCRITQGSYAAMRQRHQDRFLRDEGVVMVATIAFGMGI